MIRCQNKFTDRKEKKYLSVDKLHLQQTQIVKDTNQSFWSSFNSLLESK